MGRYWYTVPCWFDQTARGPISQFMVAICACADLTKIVKLPLIWNTGWGCVMYINVCTSCILEYLVWEGILYNKFNKTYSCCSSIDNRMLRVVTLKSLTKEHVHVWKSVVHGVIRTFTNCELAYFLERYYDSISPGMTISNIIANQEAEVQLLSLKLP